MKYEWVHVIMERRGVSCTWHIKVHVSSYHVVVMVKLLYEVSNEAAAPCEAPAAGSAVIYDL